MVQEGEEFLGVAREALPVHLFRHFCCGMCRLATIRSIAEGRTNRWTDRYDIVVTVADHTDQRLIKCNSFRHGLAWKS